MKEYIGVKPIRFKSIQELFLFDIFNIVLLDPLNGSHFDSVYFKLFINLILRICQIHKKYITLV